MFDNIGAKIMKLAKILCWIGIVLSVISGIVLMAGGANTISYYDTYGNRTSTRTSTGGVGVLGGILVIVLGCLGSWIGSFFTYGFGQQIDNSEKIKESLQHKDQSTFG